MSTVCSPMKSRISSMPAVYGRPRRRTQSRMLLDVGRKGGVERTGRDTIGEGGSVEIRGVDM